MSADRTRRPRAPQCSFRPAIDGRPELEPRLLLSRAALAMRAPLHAAAAHPAPAVRIHTAQGGRAVAVTDSNGFQFYIQLASGQTNGVTGISNAGFVHAYPMSGGRVGLIVDGTTPDSILTINAFNKHQSVGVSHQFSSNLASGQQILNIGAITVTSGEINSVLGYHTADLSGPLVASSTQPVNRVAFAALLPGASIQTGGDLDILTVLHDTTLDGPGTGINVGRDLNWLYSTGNISLQNGATLTTGRDLGLFLQPSEGSAPGGQGGFIVGNLVIGPGSSLAIGRDLVPTTGTAGDAGFTINGFATGVSRITVSGPNSTGTFDVVGGVTP